jgi:hypothetical protein
MIKIGLTIKYYKEIFSNGINQNILFFYNLLHKKGYDTYLITDKKYLDEKYNFLDFRNQEEMNSLDYYIQIGCSLPIKVLENMKKNVTLIKIVLGNEYVSHIDDILHEKTNNFDIESTFLFDKVWISPHFEFSIDYYRYLYKCQISVCPYIWEPMYLEKYTGAFSKEINIGIFESNLNSNKSCFYPMIICDRAKQYINNVYVFNTLKLKKYKMFTDFANKSSLSKEKKMTFEGRFPFVKIMNKYCNVVISFTENWGLNYLHLECFHLGIPIIHNSKFFKKYGFYYDKYNVHQALKHLENLYKNGFDKQKYIEKHKDILYKYSSSNPKNIDFFIKNLKKKEKHIAVLVKYNSKCIESLLKQNYTNYKIYVNSDKKDENVNYLGNKSTEECMKLIKTQYIVIADSSHYYDPNMLSVFNKNVKDYSVGFFSKNISNVSIMTDTNNLELPICYNKKFIKKLKIIPSMVYSSILSFPVLKNLN